ncbi:rhomboid family intramembrane serine protease [Ottowia sp. GY511]|uniref:Rhomboid family intramembrane serine protease n=1 Tax=Ottowia flava TaxID=2675430 RepID=A0ABW4KV37_9BURK|nr:rhomboid family intramembrane serine protease [Ottowia sp. GY511]TXK27061.1 rhomboid family intramembrane serine protease [Ottowia sp. GY511]
MRRIAWPLLCAVLVVASGTLWLVGVAGYVDPPRWVWQYDHWRALPWTLWTGPLLHFLWPHLLANVLALVALAVLGAALEAPPRDALALLLAWPLGTAALYAWPGVGAFYGLSGVVHAATAVVAVRALATPSQRWLGLLLAGGLAIKLALERAWKVPVGFDSGWGFNVIYAAHLTGALAGAVLATAFELLRAGRPERGQ